VKVRVIGSGVGAITESDVTLAESSEAVLLGFNVVQITQRVKNLIKMVSIFVTTAYHLSID
jgi:translation initiation factor IF-2